MLLLVGVLLLIALAGLLGLWWGVQRSLLALVGTLLGVVLVELWGPTWGAQLQAWVKSDDPAGLAWPATASGFLIVVLILGFGSAVLLPRSGKSKGAGEHFAGGLVGILNGLLITGFLLHYGTALASEAFITTVQTTQLLTMVRDWLPWYVLAVVLSMGIWIVILAVVRLVQVIAPAMASRYEDEEPAGTPQRRPSPSQSRKLQGVSSKIDQVLKNRR